MIQAIYTAQIAQPQCPLTEMMYVPVSKEFKQRLIDEVAVRGMAVEEPARQFEFRATAL